VQTGYAGLFQMTMTWIGRAGSNGTALGNGLHSTTAGQTTGWARARMTRFSFDVHNTNSQTKFGPSLMDGAYHRQSADAAALDRHLQATTASYSQTGSSYSWRAA
jgi:hypothetical protein